MPSPAGGGTSLKSQSRGETGGTSAAASKLVRHVPLVATLLIVQGVLECLLVLLYACLLPLVNLPELFDRSQENPWIFVSQLLGLVLLMAFTLAMAVVKLVAGIRNRRWQGRVLGLVALSSGLISCCTLWCGPTGIALGIYGLIVYTDQGVLRTFRAAAGDSPLRSEQPLTAQWFRRATQAMTSGWTFQRVFWAVLNLLIVLLIGVLVCVILAIRCNSSLRNEDATGTLSFPPRATAEVSHQISRG
jgi:hypothetical protein